MTSADLKDELSCSICLSIYTDPVTLKCGHNFCRDCIDHVLDTQEPSRRYTCPECREEFQERPVLYSARALRNIAEKFLISQPNQKETGIFCTYCVDSPVPAIKSCFICESSLCGKHLRVHVESPEHVLSDPTDFPRNRKCPVHKKVLEYYCTKDRVTVCVYCIAVGDHKGHQVESLDEASEKKKEKLRKDLEIMTSKKIWTKKQVWSLQERRTDMQEKAAGVIKRVAALFRDVRRDLEELQKKTLSEISKQEEKISLSISNLIQKLEIQKEEISRKMSHIEELGKSMDPLTILRDQNFVGEDICHTEQEDSLDTVIPYEGDFHEDLIIDTLHKLSDIMKDMHLCIQQPAGFLLDEETAANNIQISGDMKTASWLAVALNRPETTKRFKYNQVLSRRSFSSGQHNWEVDMSHSTSWRIGLCYLSMDRKSVLGQNKNSWCLRRGYDEYNMIIGSKYMPFLHKPTSQKFRISLDYKAGQISFYELSEPIRHLHTSTTTFTKPLQAMIALWDGSMTITN